MSALPADQHVEDTTLDTEISGIVSTLLEEHGSERAALRALAHDFIVLLADAEVSRGYLRGLFSQGARPVRESVSYGTARRRDAVAGFPVGYRAPALPVVPTRRRLQASRYRSQARQPDHDRHHRRGLHGRLRVASVESGPQASEIRDEMRRLLPGPAKTRPARSAAIDDRAQPDRGRQG